jgi:membrane-associated HD superfamily phosphohydrolase
MVVRYAAVARAVLVVRAPPRTRSLIVIVMITVAAAIAIAVATMPIAVPAAFAVGNIAYRSIAVPRAVTRGVATRRRSVLAVLMEWADDPVPC